MAHDVPIATEDGSHGTGVFRANLYVLKNGQEGLSDPTDARELGRLLAQGAHVEAGEGAIDFFLAAGAVPPRRPLTARDRAGDAHRRSRRNDVSPHDRTWRGHRDPGKLGGGR